MKQARFQEQILKLQRAERPAIVIVKRAENGGPRLGVFASSFDPITTAHVALIEQAASAFSLDQVLALAGTANADKQAYDCPLGVILEMLELAFGDKKSVSIGVSSSAFFVDMVDAIHQAYPAAVSPFFIVGFDTFVRILDFEGRYVGRYSRTFLDRSQAFEYLRSSSYLIVAARGGQGESEVSKLVAREPKVAGGHVLFLDFPADLGERSSTEVRERIRSGLPVTGLVPAAVESYIETNNLYSAG